MLQDINLYIPPEKPKMEILDAEQMQRLTLAFVAGLIVLYGVFVWLKSSKEGELSQLEKERIAKENALLEYKLKKDDTRTRDQLERALASAKAVKAAKENVVNILNDASKTNVSGFSEILVGLASSKLNGIWLDKFEIKAAGNYVSLKGRSVNDSLVPRMIGNLGNTKAFNGKKFTKLKVTRESSEKNLIQFELESKEK